MLNQRPSGAGLTYVFLATVGWSLSGMFVRLMPGLDGWQINAWRGLWLALSLLVYLVLTHGREIRAAFSSVPMPALVISSLCFAAGTTCYVSSLTLVNTAAVSVIGATSPLITALLSPWVTGERPHILSWVAALVAIIGMMVIAQHGIQVGNVAGLILSICVPLTFALQTLLLRRYRNFDMMTTICIGGFLSFVAAGFASFYLGAASVFTVSSHDMMLLVAMGIVQLALPLIFYGWGAKSVPAVTLSLVAMLDAVFNPFWSWAFAGELPEASAVLGGAIILGAVLISVVGVQDLSAAPCGMTRGRATLIGFLAVLMWATLAALSAMSGPVPPFQLTAMTFVIGGVLCAVTWPFRPGAFSSLKQDWRIWALGIGGLFSYHALYFAAVKNAPPIDVSLTAYLWPMLIVVLSGFLPGHHLRLHHLVGTLLGLLGAATVITKGQGFGFSGGLQLGHFLAFPLPLIWAGYSLLARRTGEVPTDVVAGFCLATALLSTVAHFAFESTVWPQATSQWLAVLALGLFPVGAAFYVWDYGLKHGDIFVLGALSYCSPLFSTIVLVATGLAPYHWSVLIACVLITLGAVIASKDMLFRRAT